VTPTAPPSSGDLAARISRRHLVIGWTGLLIFLALGIVLETLHGLKSSYYLDTRNAARRMMWTLAHSHGTLFSLVNIAFALSLSRLAIRPGRLRLASATLVGGLVLLPLGFLLGGVKLYGGDPGPGILLVPVGAASFLVGVGVFALETWRSRGSGSMAPTPPPQDSPAAPGSGSKRNPGGRQHRGD